MTIKSYRFQYIRRQELLNVEQISIFKLLL